MRRSTKIEREVLQMSAHLPALNEHQREYAKRHCFEHNAQQSKKDDTMCYCLDCGCYFKFDRVKAQSCKGVTCPNCETQVRVYNSPKEVKKIDKQTFQIITTRSGWQVIRTFHVKKVTKVREAAEYTFWEVSQVWIKPGYKDVIVARPLKPLTWYVDGFNYNRPMDIRNENKTKAEYRINASATYNRRSVLPILKRNGYCKELYALNPAVTFKRLLYNPHYETLAKTGRFDIWGGMADYQLERYWRQVKMIIRHGYYPKDFIMWEDTLRLAEELGEDNMAERYVLAEDLAAVHDRLVDRLHKRNERLSAEAARRKERKKHRGYLRYRAWFGAVLGVCIKQGDLEIRPLLDYGEYEEEGRAMHHCVATYWGRRNSLILSVRASGRRIATVEVDMRDMSIRQCRGVCNEKPARYEEICGVIEGNRGVFVKNIL